MLPENDCFLDSAVCLPNCMLLDTVASQCNEIVCLNGGSCFQSTTTGEYICTCMAGFTGDICGNGKYILH